MHEHGTQFRYERRSLPRRPMTRPITIQSHTGTFKATTGITCNVSGSGIYLTTLSSVAVGAAVELLFDMPTVVGDGFYPVLCRGTVVRVDRLTDEFGIAVAFREIENVGRA